MISLQNIRCNKLVLKSVWPYINLLGFKGIDSCLLYAFQHASDVRDLPERAGGGDDAQVPGQGVLGQGVQRDRPRANRYAAYLFPLVLSKVLRKRNNCSLV